MSGQKIMQIMYTVIDDIKNNYKISLAYVGDRLVWKARQVPC